jgi:RNA polymerase sigma-70 factor, ECF subfamily
MSHAKQSIRRQIPPSPEPKAIVLKKMTQEAALGPVFEELYQAHCSPLRRAALNWVGNVHDAEDAVQEAFLRAFRGAASFAGQSALSTWLYRILINICHDLRRQRIRRPEPQELGNEHQSKARQWVVTEDHPLRLSLERTLRRLNPRHSSVLLMFEVEGLKHSEIAAALRITEGASKTRLSQARRQLREMLSYRGS